MRLVVDGMTCAHCVRAITGAIKRLDASALVHVDLDNGEVAITGNVEVAAAVQAIGGEGYPVVAILEDGATPPATSTHRPACCSRRGPEESVELA